MNAFLGLSMLLVFLSGMAAGAWLSAIAVRER